MRLLHTSTLRQEEFLSDDLPPYAILCHMWGPNEVFINDLKLDELHALPGYGKLQAFTVIARNQGLDWCWIDTCCIDRTNSAELSESMNSLFQWLKRAAVCHVYLEDVEPIKAGESMVSSRALKSFKKSRWFTRGWALQELLAPRTIVFWSKSWTPIGSKVELQTIISDITGIPTDVLTCARRLDECSVTERLAWAEPRKTRTFEDQAYCRMSLFDISMPIMYGEGPKAMQRLLKEIMESTNQASGLRLLLTQSRELLMETFVQQEGLEYGILSHTWTGSELSFQNLMMGKGENTLGYSKIQECRKLAARDQLAYVWVDTCCINKSSSAELQEAICSMYKWYRQAAICYVYLEDYRHNSGDSLAKCKWFSRGWTLQELIAPSKVEFFDQNWHRIGSKIDLLSEIASITGIHPAVLRGEQTPMQRSVAERMSWAARRNTTRIEDAAYSLMGLFNVFMPMLYGEGDRAFLRLQQQILVQDEDHTLFAWDSGDTEAYPTGLLARSPGDFASFAGFPQPSVRSAYGTAELSVSAVNNNSPAISTSRGINIGLPLLTLTETIIRNIAKNPSNKVAANVAANELECRQNWNLPPRVCFALIYRVLPEGSSSIKNVCLYLQQDPTSGIFSRVWSVGLTVLCGAEMSAFKTERIYVKA